MLSLSGSTAAAANGYYRGHQTYQWNFSPIHHDLEDGIGICNVCVWYATNLNRLVLSCAKKVSNKIWKKGTK